MFKLLAVVAALAVAANAVSISWTGYAGDNQWTNKINWSPDQVPGTGDDVVIPSGVVLVTVPTGVNSLMMGDSFNAPANLTIFQSFFIGTGGMQVQGNGNLFINSGTAAVTGQVTIGGTLYFQSGMISGQWLINNRGVADLSGAAQKAFSACQFTSQAASFTFSGVMALNQSSQIIVQSTAVFSNDVSIQAQDSTQVLLDTSAGTLTYTGNGDLQIQAPLNIGVFNYQGGNITIFDTVSFVHHLMIPSGCFVSTVGTAAVNLSVGVSGAGVLSAAGNTLTLGNTSLSGALNIIGGNVTFAAAGSTVAVLTLSGGFTIVNYAVWVSQLNLVSGNIIGGATVTAKQLYFSTPGFNLDSAIVATSTASMGGLLAFGTSGSLTFSSTCAANALSSLTLTGAPGQTVTNNGILTVANAIAFQNINLAGTGTVVASSSLSFQTATVQQASVTLQGAGVFKGATTQIVSIAAVKAASVVNAVIGAYSFTCPKECDSVTTSTIPTSNFQFTA